MNEASRRQQLQRANVGKVHARMVEMIRKKTQIITVKRLAVRGAVEKKNARIGLDTPVRQRTFFDIETLIEANQFQIVGIVVQIRHLAGITPLLNAIEQWIETSRSTRTQALVTNGLQQPAWVNRNVFIAGPHGCGILKAPMDKKAVAIRRPHLIEKSRRTVYREMFETSEKTTVGRCYLNLSIRCKHHEDIARMKGFLGLNPRAAFHVVHRSEN